MSANEICKSYGYTCNCCPYFDDDIYGCDLEEYKQTEAIIKKNVKEKLHQIINHNT